MHAIARRSGVAGGCGLVMLAVAGWPGLARAQAALQARGSGAAVRPAPTSPAVIVPHPGIDPGIRIRPPHLPAASTPVLKPRMGPSPGTGTVVVPR